VEPTFNTVQSLRDFNLRDIIKVIIIKVIIIIITLACKKKLFFCGKNQNRWVLLISLC